MSTVVANRGEWSELYAIGYLLTRGGGFAADEFSRIDTSLFYKVLEVVDNPSGRFETVYKIHEKDIEILQNGVTIIRVTKDEIVNKLSNLFKDLVIQTKSHAFSLESGQKLMKLIQKEKLSASSSMFADIYLILEDLITKTETPKKAFSVKSEIGSAATIFNASRSTNLTYRILGQSSPKPFESVSAVKTNVKSLLQNGFTLEFHSYDNPIFEKSLKNIDSNLPNYLAKVLLSYTESTTTKISKICEIAFPASDNESDLKIQKIKKFIRAASMGLKAATEWSDYPEDFGGIILVKNDGDVLFYYLYNIKKFEEYLFNNLRFDTPSATRHNFGQVYQEGSDFFIKLNVQIRY